MQGGIVPAAAGIAMAEQLSGSDALSVVFSGDGTLGEGLVYETLNIASLWNLPLLVVVEDNEWSQSTPSLASASDVIPGAPAREAEVLVGERAIEATIREAVR